MRRERRALDARAALFDSDQAAIRAVFAATDHLVVNPDGSITRWKCGQAHLLGIERERGEEPEWTVWARTDNDRYFSVTMRLNWKAPHSLYAFRLNAREKAEAAWAVLRVTGASGLAAAGFQVAEA